MDKPEAHASLDRLFLKTDRICKPAPSGCSVQSGQSWLVDPRKMQLSARAPLNGYVRNGKSSKLYSSRRVSPCTFRQGLRLCTTTAAASGQTAAAAAATAPQAPPSPDAVLHGLCSASGIDSGAVELKHVSRDKGSGLFAARDIAKGEAVLRVPRSMCIIIDKDTGSMTIPAGNWPRLSGGLMQENALTWDILQGLALMDAIAGDGDPFYEVYADQVLPEPADMTLPMCWPADLLAELQHPDIIQAAQAQQDRLRGMLPPEYMTPIEDGLPSYLQWGFACVRSRAFQVGQQAFGCVPFLDLVNHADQPNTDLQVSPGTPEEQQQQQQDAGDDVESDSSRVSGSEGFVSLVALSDIPQGTELTMSYSGKQGFTNQRFMAQYGFVPAGGNPADRMVFVIPDSLKACTLRMSLIENALGAKFLLEAAQGQNPHIIAALRSLPLFADDVQEQDAADMAAAASSDGSSSSGEQGNSKQGSAAVTSEEMQLAAVLNQQIENEKQGFKTSLPEDEQLLVSLLMRPPQLPEAAAASLGALATDPRLLSAIKYRIERKRLLQACSVLLKPFLTE